LRAPLHKQRWSSISDSELHKPVEILAVKSWHYQPDEISGHFNQVMKEILLIFSWVLF
jgi:hypothetical protein